MKHNEIGNLDELMHAKIESVINNVSIDNQSSLVPVFMAALPCHNFSSGKVAGKPSRLDSLP